MRLPSEGFIHASRADQWTGVRDRFYADVTEPLVLLHIDTDLLDVPVVEEPAVPGDSETFPHIYGRLRDILQGRAEGKDDPKLAPADREAILEILLATKTDLPDD